LRAGVNRRRPGCDATSHFTGAHSAPPDCVDLAGAA